MNARLLPVFHPPCSGPVEVPSADRLELGDVLPIEYNGCLHAEHFYKARWVAIRHALNTLAHKYDYTLYYTGEYGTGRPAGVKTGTFAYAIVVRTKFAVCRSLMHAMSKECLNFNAGSWNLRKIPKGGTFRVAPLLLDSVHAALGVHYETILSRVGHAACYDVGIAGIRNVVSTLGHKHRQKYSVTSVKTTVPNLGISIGNSDYQMLEALITRIA